MAKKFFDNMPEVDRNALAASLNLSPTSFKGLAETTTTPTVVEGVSQWWLASGAGTYTNFGGLVITGNFAVLSYSGSAWSKWETTITAPVIEQARSQSTSSVASSKLIDDEIYKETILREAVKLLTPYQTDSGVSISTSGNSQLSNTGFSIKRFQVSQGQKLWVKSRLNSSVQTGWYAFYSGSSIANIISGTLITANAGIQVLDSEIVVPSGALYFFITSDNKYPTLVGLNTNQIVETNYTNLNGKITDNKNIVSVVESEVVKRKVLFESNATPIFSNINLVRIIKEISFVSNTLSFYKPNGSLRKFYIYGIGMQASSVFIIGVKYEDDNAVYQNIGSSVLVDLTAQSDIANVLVNVGYSSLFTMSFLIDATTINGTALVVNPTVSQGKLSDEIALEYLRSKNLAESLAKPNYSDLLLYPKKTELLTISKNLYDKSLQIAGQNGAADGYLDDNGNVVSHATAKTSYYMPIATGDFYAQAMYGSSTRVVTYDSNYNKIRVIYSGFGASAPANDKLTFTSSEAFARFSIRDVNTFMLEVGSTMHSYEAYFSSKIKSSFITGLKDLSSLKIVCFGDSITNGKTDPGTGLFTTWVEQLANLIGVTYALEIDNTTLVNKNVINMGSSGMRIAYQATTVETTDVTLLHEDNPANNVLYNWIKRFEYINTIGYVPDVFIIAAGTNDISQASDLGTFADAFSADTFNNDLATLNNLKMTAALKRCLLYLQINYPLAQIIYCTPIHGTYGGRNYATLKNVADLNTQVSNRMQVLVCDNFKEGGINGIFENNPYRDTIDGVHPSTAGAVKIARNILNTMKNKLK